MSKSTENDVCLHLRRGDYHFVAVRPTKANSKQEGPVTSPWGRRMIVCRRGSPLSPAGLSPCSLCPLLPQSEADIRTSPEVHSGFVGQQQMQGPPAQGQPRKQSPFALLLSDPRWGPSSPGPHPRIMQLSSAFKTTWKQAPFCEPPGVVSFCGHQSATVLNAGYTILAFVTLDGFR